MLRIICLIFFLLFLVQVAYSQRGCGVKYHPNQNPLQFENWLKNKILERKSQTQAFGAARTEAMVVTIPIVVHVIHNGEPVGIGTNIPLGQVLSQITVLNEDFRRLNADTVSTPPEFQSVAADIEVEFIMAQQEPDGASTMGIAVNRVQGTKSVWNPNFIEDWQELSSLSYWPAEDFLNIWVTNLSSGILGFAQFPISELDGLNGFNDDPLIDGILVDFAAFGTSDLGAFPALQCPFDKGRTATHEIGHFLGLRHIWGDGSPLNGCGFDDFCADTPDATDSYSGCPAISAGVSCTTQDMFQNYLDFTDDDCMNIFTLCQKDRMRTVLDSSPRRASLTTSPGLNAPPLVNNDLGIRQVISPELNICQSPITPMVEIRNYGTNQVSNYKISVSLDGQFIQTVTISAPLDTFEITTVVFPVFDVSGFGSHSITYQVEEVNGGADNNPSNDVLQLTFYVPILGVTPITEDFNTLPPDWVIMNPDNLITWDTADAPSTTINNRALFMNFFDYELESVGQMDYFLSPLLQFGGVIFAEVSFDVAYAPSNRIFPEGLQVAVLTDCGNTFTPSNVVFEKLNNQLATVTAIDSPFVPTGPGDWRTETINLTQFTGESNVLIGFIALNGYGNNLYVDDINIRIDREFSVSILSPAEISCENEVSPSIEIVNPRMETINKVEVEYEILGQISETLVFANLNLPFGQLGILNFSPITLANGTYDLNVKVLTIDDDTAGLVNNTDELTFTVDNSKESIPFRQNFEEMGIANWLVQGDSSQTWTLTQTDGLFGSFSAFVPNFVQPPPQKPLLISPFFDLDSLTEASLEFKVSQVQLGGLTDTLRVLLSTNCGESFDQSILQIIGSDSLPETMAEWFPEGEEDWVTHSIDLRPFIGITDVRIAFEFSSGTVNNLFIDDIEFFTTSQGRVADVPNNTFTIFPNPAGKNFNLAFNLEEKQDLTVFIYDPSGRVHQTVSLPNTLNQTHQFDFSNKPLGLYILRVIGASYRETKRVSINR